jgi:hypothetical protein
MINGTMYWSEDLGGQYVCGRGSPFRWTNSRQYEHTRRATLSELILWALAMLFLLLGMTGSWPVIYRM